MKRGNKRKFGRTNKQRTVLYKALATALIDHGKIKTTEAKAKSISGFVEKLITKSVKGDISSRKLALQYVGEKSAKKLYTELGPKFKDKKGGYTRITKLGQRKSDGAPMALIEFTL